VFATRSPRRPNPIGMSAVELLEVNHEKFTLVLGGVDLVHKTPILDIKPYVPYSDRIPEAENRMAPAKPTPRPVRYTQEALANITDEFQSLVTDTLALDPRPAYHEDDREYGVTLEGWNIRWKADGEGILVLSVRRG